uniref:Uncharacterized protein LOC105037609 n=1 Tax=Elaeis guineensis var. tenera TaxID=51953 RepID=A0A6I9QM01_ELAGV|nr:uncharacterized protein LOC105037609 [Elaeis guineensis]
MLMLRLASSGALRFQSITDSIHHMTSPLRVKTKNCVGVSFGYLIIVDRSWRQPSLVDPFTSTTICLPKQGFRIRFAILTAPPSSPDCLLLGWGLDLDAETCLINAIAVCELKGSCGTVLFWPFSFRNAIFRDGKIFAMLDFSAGMVIDLVHHPKPRFTAVRPLSIPSRISNLMLTKAGGDLLLVSRDLLSGRICVDACPLDLKRKDWVRLTSLGGRALFLSYNRCEVLENPTEWEGGTAYTWFLEIRW